MPSARSAQRSSASRSPISSAVERRGRGGARRRLGRRPRPARYSSSVAYVLLEPVDLTARTSTSVAARAFAAGRSQRLAVLVAACARRRPGEENSRFLSSLSTNSVANVSASSSVAVCAAARCSAAGAAWTSRSSSVYVDLERLERPRVGKRGVPSQRRRQLASSAAAPSPRASCSRSGATPRANRWSSSSSSSAVKLSG